MIDREFCLSEVKARVQQFIELRDWEQYHTPRNLAESISIEAAELLQIFQWMDVGRTKASLSSPDFRRKITEELSDVLIYCLSLANVMKIDISEAIFEKIKINEKKYPVDSWKGKAWRS